MSQRKAFALSLVFTIVLAAGVVAGRDRLFAAPASDPTPNAPAATTILSGNASEPALTTTGSAPRVIEIPLPAPQGDAAPSSFASRQGSDDDHRDDRSHDGEDGEHEEGDDD